MRGENRPAPRSGNIESINPTSPWPLEIGDWASHPEWPVLAHDVDEPWQHGGSPETCYC
jgi:hypothetical protein